MTSQGLAELLAVYDTARNKVSDIHNQMEMVLGERTLMAADSARFLESASELAEKWRSYGSHLPSHSDGEDLAMLEMLKDEYNAASLELIIRTGEALPEDVSEEMAKTVSVFKHQLLGLLSNIVHVLGQAHQAIEDKTPWQTGATSKA